MRPRKSLLPRAISSRKRLNLREALWVYSPAPYLIAGTACLVCSAFLAGDVIPILLVALGTAFVVGAGACCLMIVDGGSFADRRSIMMADRPRRRREHRQKSGFRELHNRHPQYAVSVRRVGSEMEFTVMRYEPPDGGALRRAIVPWRDSKQKWDVSSEKWRVQNHVLRVANPQTNLLTEAYCEAAEAARALEGQAYEQHAKDVALDGMALAFTPPGGKATNEKQLEQIRERVQVRRLLDSGD